MTVERKSLGQPEERKTPPKTTMEIVTIAGTSFARTRFEPGWRWSECLKPVVGGDHCQVHHVGYALEGRLHVVHQDGAEAEIGPGDAYDIAPGHEGWVVGDEAFVDIEFRAASG